MLNFIYKILADRLFKSRVLLAESGASVKVLLEQLGGPIGETAQPARCLRRIQLKLRPKLELLKLTGDLTIAFD